MIFIKGFKLISDNESKPSNNRKLVELAVAFNTTTNLKIAIFKSFQEIDFSFSSENQLQASVKGITLPKAAIDQIIEEHYAVIENRLFFFNEKSINELAIVSNEKRPLEISRFLRQLPQKRRPSSSEIENYLSSLKAHDDFNPTIELTIELYGYQKQGVAWLSSRYDSGEGCILADDMGLGKTAQVISLITTKIRSGGARRILIVVPNSLIANWLNEFKKFTQGIKLHVHWGNSRFGFTKQLEKFDVVITTYATIVNDLLLFEQIFFDIAIFDEASLLKNPDSQRTVAIGKLSYGVAVAITGTPFENSMMDLWSISNVVSANFLGDKEVYKQAYVSSGVQELEDSDVEIVEEKLRPILLRRMKSEVLSELPEKIDIYRPLTMGINEQAGYEMIEAQIKNTLEDKNAAFALIAQLRKYTAHPLLADATLQTASFKTMMETSSKFEFLVASLSKVVKLGEKALIFASHVRILDTFTRIFADEFNVPCFKVDGSVNPRARQNVIEQFSMVDGSAFIFLNPITAGMGLNITAANHVFHYSRQWNPALEDQATARAHRNGQALNVNVYYLYYANSIEQTIHERIMVKSDIAEGVVKKTQIRLHEDELIFDLIQI